MTTSPATTDSSTSTKALYDETERPLLINEWEDRDQFELTKLYSTQLRKFQRLEHLKNCYIWLESWIEQPGAHVWYSRNTRLILGSAIQLYDIKFGSPQGIRLGYVIRTPLSVKLADSYFIAYRKALDLDADIRDKAEAQRKYNINGLLFFTLRDESFMMSALPEQELSDYLDG